MNAMTDATALASGKGNKDENFPVASRLVRPDARAPIMAYYRFARAADDIADHAHAAPAEKLRLLGLMRAGLADDPLGDANARALAQVAAERGLPLTHASDLLDAFEQDVTKNRYADWDDLIAYCRKSAMPVGRWVLDVHGEDRALWPMNDALCAALQIINHLQDCGKDYREIDRVYVPEPMLAAAGLTVEALGAAQSGPALLGVIRDLTLRTRDLLDTAAPFANAIRDTRLALEVAVIQTLASDLVRLLLTRDPLVGGVHHGSAQAALLSLGAAARQALGRALRRTLIAGKAR